MFKRKYFATKSWNKENASYEHDERWMKFLNSFYDNIISRLVDKWNSLWFKQEAQGGHVAHLG